MADATPSASAALATAAATATDVSRRSATRGSSGAPGVEMPTRSATARAAASSIPSVTRPGSDHAEAQAREDQSVVGLAVPIPKITILWPVSGIPDALVAASTAGKLTAPVPWMSSLKVSRSSRYRSSSRLAFATPRSSQCSSASGISLPTARTNSSRKASYSAAGTRG